MFRKRSKAKLRRRKRSPRRIKQRRRPGKGTKWRQGNEDHFREEGFSKTPFSMENQVCHGCTRRPGDLQVVPHSDAKVAIEEQMISCFPSTQGAENTIDPIIHMPVPSVHHILCRSHRFQITSHTTNNYSCKKQQMFIL